MSEADPGTQKLAPTTELLDVLIRGLDMARRKVETAVPGEEGPVELFCTFSYVEPGTVFCTFLYYHA